jgi:signal transduction histidine kinase/CheY-like chemotaxis protein
MASPTPRAPESRLSRLSSATVPGLVGIAVVLLACLALSLKAAHHYLVPNLGRQVRLQDLSGQIRHLDEVLTMSARMAASTGDLRWEDRYWTYEPQLGAAIEELIALSPQVFAETLGEDTDEANQQLVAMEEQSFELLRAGDAEGAREVLFSPAYETQKQLYAAGWARAEAILAQAVHADSRALLDELTALAALSGAAALLLVIGVVRLNRARHRLREQASRERLEAAEAGARAKGEFLANMSHEIRTPMTAILGYAELLGDLHQSPEERANCVHIIRRNGKHLLAIIDDILDLSKIEAGAMAVERAPTSSLQVMQEVLSLMQVRAGERGIGLRAEYHLPLPRQIESDSTRLRQVLLNLVGNAIKFTPEGEVVVSLSYDGQSLAFAVRDTGVGMDDEQLVHLFQPFSQVGGSASRRFGGTGLGLVISRRMAHMLGGEIEVQSAPGRGSTFTLRLEAGTCAPDQLVEERRELETVRTVAPVSEPVRAAKLVGRILLAEDGLDNQRLVGLHLRRAGAEVTIAENGRLAVEAVLAAQARGEAFDLVLMDMQMPEMDGYAATRSLRRAGLDLPIVALTAHAMPGDRERCLAAGCVDHLTKPIDRDRLLATCAELMARPPLPAQPSAAKPAPGPAAQPGPRPGERA